MLMRTVCMNSTWAFSVLFLPAISSLFASLLTPSLTSHIFLFPSLLFHSIFCFPSYSCLMILPYIPFPSSLFWVSEMSPSSIFFFFAILFIHPQAIALIKVQSIISLLKMSTTNYYEMFSLFLCLLSTDRMMIIAQV